MKNTFICFCFHNCGYVSRCGLGFEYGTVYIAAKLKKKCNVSSRLHIAKIPQIKIILFNKKNSWQKNLEKEQIKFEMVNKSGNGGKLNKLINGLV